MGVASTALGGLVARIRVTLLSGVRLGSRLGGEEGASRLASRQVVKVELGAGQASSSSSHTASGAKDVFLVGIFPAWDCVSFLGSHMLFRVSCFSACLLSGSLFRQGGHCGTSQEKVAMGH